MANLILTLDEIIKIAKKNYQFPPQLSEISSTGDKIQLTINPGKFLPEFNAFIKFDKFANSKILLKVESSNAIDLILKFVKIPSNEWFNFNMPKITIDINKLISTHIKGVQISDITFQNNEFLVTL